MDDDLIKRGGRIGAILAFLITVLAFDLIYVTMIANYRMRGEWPGLAGLLCPLGMALLMASIGSMLGKAAALCPTVGSAFRRGAIIAGLTCLAILGCLFLGAAYIGLLTDFDAMSCFWAATILLCFITASVSFLFGLTAICLRDYRRFQRQRLIPQFTLQEMLITLTLAAAMMGALTSVVIRRL